MSMHLLGVLSSTLQIFLVKQIFSLSCFRKSLALTLLYMCLYDLHKDGLWLSAAEQSIEAFSPHLDTQS